MTRRFVIWVVFSYGAFFYIGRFVVHDVFSFGTFRGKFPYKCAVGGWERIFWLSSLTSQTCWIWTIGIIKKCLSGCHTQRQHGGGEYIFNIKCDIPHFPSICMLVLWSWTSWLFTALLSAFVAYSWNREMEFESPKPTKRFWPLNTAFKRKHPPPRWHWFLALFTFPLPIPHPPPRGWEKVQ